MGRCDGAGPADDRVRFGEPAGFPGEIPAGRRDGITGGEWDAVSR